MKTTARGGVSRTLAVTGLTVVGLGFAPVGAYAADGAIDAPTITYVGAGDGYDFVIDGRSAGFNIVTLDALDDGDLETYCLQYGVPAATSGTFSDVDWADSGIKDVDIAAYIAANHASIGTPLGDQHSEAAATQLAIWSHTDSVDYTSVPNADIVARAAVLAATTSTLTEPVNAGDDAHLNVVTSDAGAGQVALTVTVTDADGDVVPGAKVRVSDGDGDDVLTADASGVASEVLPADYPYDEVQVGLSYTYGAGLVLAPDNGGQLVVTSQSATREVTAGVRTVDVPDYTVATAPPTPAPSDTATDTATTAATPAASATPVATAADKPTSLPRTGPIAGVTALGALLAAGAGFGVYARRKRTV